MGKLYTMMWLPRLEKVIVPHIAHLQMGGMRGSSAELAAWTLTSLVDHKRGKTGARRQLYACLADTETAFDTVWQEGLYFVLHAYGVKGTMLRMIKEWHSGSTLTAQWHSIQSELVTQTRGVRQGCVIAPLLYVAFVNPLVGDKPHHPDHPFPHLLNEAFSGGLRTEDGVVATINGSNYTIPGILYMDDVAILTEDPRLLQEQLDRYSSHCAKWRYSLSLKKFQVTTAKHTPVV